MGVAYPILPQRHLSRPLPRYKKQIEGSKRGLLCQASCKHIAVHMKSRNTKCVQFRDNQPRATPSFRSMYPLQNVPTPMATKNRGVVDNIT